MAFGATLDKGDGVNPERFAGSNTSAAKDTEFILLGKICGFNAQGFGKSPDLLGLRRSGQEQFRHQFPACFDHGAIGFHYEAIHGRESAG